MTVTTGYAPTSRGILPSFAATVVARSVVSFLQHPSRSCPASSQLGAWAQPDFAASALFLIQGLSLCFRSGLAFRSNQSTRKKKISTTSAMNPVRQKKSFRPIVYTTF